MNAPMTSEREQEIRAELTTEFVAWLVKKAREHRAKGPQYTKQADVIARLADKVQRGAVRPNNLLSLPPQGGPEDIPALRVEVDRLRARVAELEALKPAPIQTCQSCGAGYEYGQPCAACDFRKRMAAELAGNPDAFPRDLTPDQARRIERDRPETDTAHTCTLPLARRLDCGHCPHEVCQDCDRCPHTCRCATPRDLRPGAEAARRMIRDRQVSPVEEFAYDMDTALVDLPPAERRGADAVLRVLRDRAAAAVIPSGLEATS